MLFPVRPALLVLTVAALCATCAKPPTSAERGGVLVIAIDSLRVDHLSVYGYDRDTTPEIDALAAAGVRFEAAWSAAPGILESNVALLCGSDPRIARRLLPPDVPGSTLAYWHVPEAVPHVAQEFLREGFATAAFVDHPQLGPGVGLARGFQEFQGVPREQQPGEREPTPDELFERMSRWLDEREPGEPWFAYVHVGTLERFWWHYDERGESRFHLRPELNRVPPVGDGERLFHALPRTHWTGAQRSLAEYEVAYDAALHGVDAAIGACIDRLRAKGRLDDTTLVVVGTRGLGLGEAGLVGDCGTLTDVDLHVPLVVRPARGRPFRPGHVATGLASLIDVAPTVLALGGLPQPPEMQGVSLVEALSVPGARAREHAFASCGLQPGWVAIGERHCLEFTEPWRASSELLVRSWYGSPAPADPKPRVVLHDRERDASVGHAASAEAPESVVAPLRAAALAWEERVEELRRRHQPSDWEAKSP